MPTNIKLIHEEIAELQEKAKTASEENKLAFQSAIQNLHRELEREELNYGGFIE